MKFKSFLVGLGSFVLITAFLYLVGYTFKIAWLMWHFEYNDDKNGFWVITGSLIPAGIGLVLSYIAEKVYIYKRRH
jgi:hypothetical protein